MLPVSFRRELERLGALLEDIERSEPASGANEDALFDFQDRVADFIIKSSLLLDKAMNRVWESYNQRAPTAGKANVYFPCVDSRADFDKFLQSRQLPALATQNARLNDLLLAVQPFQTTEESWLKPLKHLAGLRHDRHPEIEDRPMKLVAPDPAKGFQIGTFVVKDGELVEDDEGWAKLESLAADDPESLEKLKAGRMRIEQFMMRVLEKAGRDPVDFCQECLREMRRLLTALFRAMPPAPA
jgi:hypothetical protein